MGGTHTPFNRTPDHDESLKSRFPDVIESLESLRSSVRSEGPLDLKTGHLIQLAAAAGGHDIPKRGLVESHWADMIHIGTG